MPLVSKTRFAEMAGVTRQAVNDAINKKKITVNGEGRTAKIDTSQMKNAMYLKNSNPQRRGESEKIADIIRKHSIFPSKNQKKTDNKKTVKGKSEKKRKAQNIESGVIHENEDSVSLTIPKNNGHGKDVEELIILAKRFEIAKTEKIEQQAVAEKLKNAKLRGELIDRETVYNNLFLYLDKLHSNLERLADSYLSDLSGDIINAKKVLPEHRSAWKNEIMSQINETKNEIVSRIRDIEKGKL